MNAANEGGVKMKTMHVDMVIEVPDSMTTDDMIHVMYNDLGIEGADIQDLSVVEVKDGMI